MSEGAAAPDAKLALRLYREMTRLRALDARMKKLQRQGRIGFYGACTGQEAVPVARGRRDAVAGVRPGHLHQPGVWQQW